ncbi:MAG: hypothetical protein RL156_93 [Bacteroidota bacterium]
MNSFRLLFVTCCVTLALACSLAVTAQSQIDMPDGEAVLAVNVITEATPAQYVRLAATRGRVYASRWSSGIWTKNAMIFEVPYSRRIVDAALKTGETGSMRSYAVLLDNGDVSVLRFDVNTLLPDKTIQNIASPFVPQGGGFNQQTYKKILFAGGLKLHFGNVVYANPLDGSPYTLDSAGQGRTNIQDIAVDMQGNLFAASTRGIVTWNNSASKWQRVSGFDSTLSPTALFIARDGRMFASVANKGVYSSINNGSSWALDTAGSGNIAFARYGDDASNNMYAVVNTTNTTSALYRKMGAGMGWSRIDSSLTLTVGGIVRINDLAGDASLELGTTVGVMSSTKNGDDWSNNTFGIAAEDIYGLQFFPGNVTVVSTSLGMFKKTATWSRTFPSTGFNGTRPLQRSANTLSFQLAGTGQGTTAQQGLIYTSTDQGSTWTLDTTGLSAVPGSTSNQIPSVFGVDMSGKKFIATGSPISVYSTPWALDTAGFYQPTGTSAASLIYSDPLSTVYVCGAIYGGGGGGGFQVRDIVLNRRTANGTSWTVDTTGLNKRPVYSLASGMDLTYAGTGLVNGVSYLYKRGANGWENIPAPATAVSDARAVVIDSSKSLFVAYSGVLSANSPNRGVYATSDDGKNWDYAGLDSLLVRGLCATGSGVYAFTNRGSYLLSRRPLRTATIQFSKNIIDFGLVDVGATKDTVITVKNSGDDTLRVSNLRTNSANFTANPAQFSVAPGDSKNITISFRPTTGGQAATTMRSVANTTPDTVYLVGQGKAANVKIILESRSIDLGIVNVGDTRDSVVSIANGGTDTLIVNGVNASVQALSIVPSSFKLAGGDSTMITIRYAPTAAGSVIGYLRFNYNGPSDSIRILARADIASVDDPTLVNTFALSLQPHPVTAANAMLKFRMPSDELMRLVLVNSLGEEMGEISSGMVSQGEHVIDLSSHVQNLSAGTYFLRMTTAHGTSAMKFMLVR